MSHRDHPFSAFIRTLGRGKRAGRHLTEAEAETAMGMILDEDVEPVQLGAFLMLMRLREESPEEVAGMVRALRARLPRLDGEPPAGALDWPSYAGKRRRPPWFVLAQRLLAGIGHPVLVHGRRGEDDARCHTETVYAALGLPRAETLEEAVRHLRHEGLCYLPVGALHPRVDELFALRPLLGLRSPINTVARMANPLSLPSVQGIFHPGYAPLHQQAAALLGDRLVSFRGEGGEGEIRPDSETRIHGHAQGQTWTWDWPPLLPSRPVRPDAWSLRALCRLWRGEEEDAYGEAAVLASAAVALRLLEPDLGVDEALQRARSAWESRDRARLPPEPLTP